MERVKKIEELSNNGERQLIFYFDSKNMLLDEVNFLHLLLDFGSFYNLKENLINFKLDEIEHYFKKKRIIYQIG